MPRLLTTTIKAIPKLTAKFKKPIAPRPNNCVKGVTDANMVIQSKKANRYTGGGKGDMPDIHRKAKCITNKNGPYPGKNPVRCFPH
jgi:hypothetical protein